jgi:hypothetical protein
MDSRPIFRLHAHMSSHRPGTAAATPLPMLSDRNGRNDQAFSAKRTLEPLSPREDEDDDFQKVRPKKSREAHSKRTLEPLSPRADEDDDFQKVRPKKSREAHSENGGAASASSRRQKKKKQGKDNEHCIDDSGDESDMDQGPTM